MTRLVWDERQYEYGLDRGVFYPKNAPGEVWNGLVSVDENDDAESVMQYLDGVKVRRLKKPGDFSGTISAFTYPDPFEHVLVKHQRRSYFDLSYRVKTADSYKIHLVYNVLVNSAGYIYQHEEAGAFTWNFTTQPMPVPGAKPSAHLIIEVFDAHPWTVEALEDVLYGSDAVMPSLPSPTNIFELFEENSILRIIDHGDGTWTAMGPDEAIVMLDPTTFEITWPSAVYISSDTYTIHSL